MIDIKCPYCNKTLHCGATLKSDKYLIDLYQCANPECESTEFLVGCKEFWDILGQLIRTRKALDVAVDTLKEIDELLSSNRFDVKEVPLLNITQTKISMLLKCINIEQKESAFVHNKIEFPEFNDNLLEEFDKQFFENGQDDDLTETALEQKDHFANASKKVEQKD